MIAVLVVVVIAVAAFAYLKFFHAAAPAIGTLAAPAVSAPTSTAAVNGAPTQMVAPASAGAETLPQAGSPTTSAAVAAVPVAPTQPVTPPAAPVAPPVDPSLQVAAGLVQKGERAYAQGDYAEAGRQARAALKAHPGDVAAARLQHRAWDAQRRVAAEERAREQQAAVAQQAAAAAAAERAAAAARVPTPDEVYNQRAHSECRRGLFGKFCRHKIRNEVCQGVQPGSPGTTVCSKNAD